MEVKLIGVEVFTSWPFIESVTVQRKEASSAAYSVLLLLGLVTKRVLAGGGSVNEGCVAVLGDGLVGLLGSARDTLLDGLGGGVGGVPKVVVSMDGGRRRGTAERT
jgi:hypothetical protein